MKFKPFHSWKTEQPPFQDLLIYFVGTKFVRKTMWNVKNVYLVMFVETSWNKVLIVLKKNTMIKGKRKLSDWNSCLPVF